MLFELAADDTAVSAEFRAGYHSCVNNIFPVHLAHNHIVNKMPMLRRRMHPSCFHAVFLLEDCISNGELVLGAEASIEQEASIVIIVANAVPTKDSFTGH